MNQGEISALHFSTQQPVKLHWQDGLIAALEPTPLPAPANVWLAPALMDLQVNGYAAVDYHSAAKLTREDLLRSVRALARDGCSQILITITTNEWSAITRRVREIAQWRCECPELKEAIAGYHLEGPFMSPVPGFVGAHPAQHMISPTPAHLRELREITGNDPLLLTVAPEQPGVIEVIPLAVSLGMRVSIGHSNASIEQITAAVKAGARFFTHLGNGCPQALDRHDNILWRVFETPGLQCGLIPDRIHLSPMLFRIMHRLLPNGRIWYTTDAVSPAGALPGRYKMLDKELEVGPDQVVREPGKTNFAGSALRPLEGIFRAAEMLGCSWQEVWPRYSKQPREFMGMDPNVLAVGKVASFCVLEFPRNGPATIKTFIRGQLVATLPAKAKMDGAGI